MRTFTATLSLLLCSLPAAAELTADQKVADFLQLAGVFSKRYAFLEWKKAALNYDGLDISSWLEKVRTSKDDLAFFNLCAQYVAGFQDSHIAFVTESTFTATLPISSDIYSGKIVIDNIDRTVLTEKSYPFQIGDEVASINAAPVANLFNALTPIMGNGDPDTTQRFAADALFYHDQSVVPDASNIPGYANVETVNSKGVHRIDTIKWSKSGIAYTEVGPVPTPSTTQLRAGARRSSASAKSAQPVPAWQQRLMSLQNFRLPRHRYLAGFDALAPFFAMPDSFKQRLGNPQTDFYFTGTFSAGGHTIGFVRIPDFEFFDEMSFQTEIQFMQTNTDALVVDVTRNPGGDGCAVQQTAAYLIPKPFQALGERTRATWDFVIGFELDAQDAQAEGATPDQVKILQQWASNALAAYKANRGFTETLPLPCGGFNLTVDPAMDSSNKVIAYTKPILVLTDNLSASAAELFAAMMQDNKRSTQFGMRTMGAGGAVFIETATTYADAIIYMPETILIRSHNVQVDGLPVAPYIENIGVRPDIEFDYQTVDNLTQQLKPFVDGFTKAVLNLIPSPSKN